MQSKGLRRFALDASQRGSPSVLVSLVVLLIVLLSCYGSYAGLRDIVFGNNALSVTTANGATSLTKTFPSIKGRRTKSKYHIIISTECSNYNEWQSYLFLYSHRQSGALPDAKVSRINSCQDSTWSKGAVNYNWLVEQFPNYREFWTPNYNPYHLTGDHYAPRNRPHSLLHLLNHLGNDFVADDEIVVLMDPDQLFIEAVTGFEVTEGYPMGAQYSSGTAFLEWARAHCDGYCDDVESPGELQIGAPYVVHAKDLKKIVPLWVDILEKIRLHNKEQGGWLSDMYAYAIATLKLNLRHNCLPMMVSSPSDDREPWSMVDKEDKGALFVLHYCQRVTVGGYSWNKHDFREEFKFVDCSFKDYLFPEIVAKDLENLDGFTLEGLPQLADALPKVKASPGDPIPREKLLLARHVWLYDRIIPLANAAFSELHSDLCSGRY